MLELWYVAYQSGVGDLTGDLTDKLRMAEITQCRDLFQFVRYNPPLARQQQSLLAQSLVLLRKRVQTERYMPEWQEVVDDVAAAYRALHGQWSANYLLLAWLAELGGQRGLETFLRLWLELPPDDSLQVALACQALLQPTRRQDLVRLFPELLTGIGHLPSAAIILDLANFLVQRRLVERHPAEARRAPLAEMLGSLAHYLEYFQERQMANLTIQQRRAMVHDCVSLAVALCQALALIGDRTYVGKLYQAVELPHRRIRVEAAYALAVLGEESGRDMLLEMAADPAVRLRVLAYADELGLADRIAADYQTEEARAESELAMWLADQSQMGMAPQQIQLVATRRLYWPGYAEPVTGYLFRYTYHLPTGDYSNIGIVGPLTFAFAADLTHLSVDDVFAIYAGWHAEHEEIFQTDVAQLSEPSRRDAERLYRRITQEGFQDVQPLRLAFFFGDRALIARATRPTAIGCESGIVVADAHDIEWWPSDPQRVGFGPEEAFAIYKGRRLLGTFNPDPFDTHST